MFPVVSSAVIVCSKIITENVVNIEYDEVCGSSGGVGL